MFVTNTKLMSCTYVEFLHVVPPYLQEMYRIHGIHIYTLGILGIKVLDLSWH